MIENLTVRLEELDHTEETLAGVFDKLCLEFNLNSKEIETDLGCKDPYALVGYIEAISPM